MYEIWFRNTSNDEFNIEKTYPDYGSLPNIVQNILYQHQRTKPQHRKNPMLLTAPGTIWSYTITRLR